jgi:hypothetical protein
MAVHFLCNRLNVSGVIVMLKHYEALHQRLGLKKYACPLSMRKWEYKIFVQRTIQD